MGSGMRQGFADLPWSLLDFGVSPTRVILKCLTLTHLRKYITVCLHLWDPGPGHAECNFQGQSMV